MNSSQVNSPYPLLISLMGGFTTFVLEVFLGPVLEEHDIPLSSLPTAILAGLTVGAILWIAAVRANQWLERQDYQGRQRRDDSAKLKSLYPDIHRELENLRYALFEHWDVDQAFRKINDLESELLKLSITSPSVPFDYDAYAIAEEWESFLGELYSYARDGDIARARRIGRSTWSSKLLLSVRSLSGWCRFRLRRLRFTLKRSKQGGTRHRGRRKGGAGRY